MHKLKKILILPCVLICFSAYSQLSYSKEYFTNLLIELNRNPKFETIQEVEKFHKNGNLSEHFVFVQFKSDTLKYLIGRAYFFHKNGCLRYYHNVDISKLNYIDSTIYFNKKGEIKCVYSYESINNELDNTIDSSNFSSQKPLHYKNYVLSELDFYPSALKIGKDLFYVNEPKSMHSIFYEDGKKRAYFELGFNSYQNRFVPQGFCYQYDKNGAITKKFDFHNNEHLCYDFLRSKKEISIDTLKYYGNSEANAYINGTLKKYKRGIYKTMHSWGNYTDGLDTVQCHFVDFSNHEPKDASYKYTYYKFVIAFVQDKYTIFTPEDIDGFSFANQIYKSLRIKNERFFVKKQYGDKIALYNYNWYNTISFQYETINFIIDQRDQKLYFVGELENKSFFKGAQSVELDKKNYKIHQFNYDQEIREYLTKLPKMNEKLKKKINNGSIPSSNLELIFASYENGNVQNTAIIRDILSAIYLLSTFTLGL